MDNVTFPAHQFVLSARSPVFARMFQNNMKENKENSVDITDIKSGVFEVGLKYIYTGRVSGVETFAYELFSFADKYQLEELQTRCQEILIQNLSTLNAFDILVLANLHSAKRLRETSIKFINHCSHKMITSEAWQHFALTHPQLVKELFEKRSTGRISTKRIKEIKSIRY